MTEAQAAAPPEPPTSTPWDQVEPVVGDGAPCYSQALKADLLPGTLVLLMGRSTILRHWMRTGTILLQELLLSQTASHHQSMSISSGT